MVKLCSTVVQIGSLDRFYLFEQRRLSKRSVSRSRRHHVRLEQEPRVGILSTAPSSLFPFHLLLHFHSSLLLPSFSFPFLAVPRYRRRWLNISPWVELTSLSIKAKFPYAIWIEAAPNQLA